MFLMKLFRYGILFNVVSGCSNREGNVKIYRSRYAKRKYFFLFHLFMGYSCYFQLVCLYQLSRDVDIHDSIHYFGGLPTGLLVFGSSCCCSTVSGLLLMLQNISYSFIWSFNLYWTILYFKWIWTNLIRQPWTIQFVSGSSGSGQFISKVTIYRKSFYFYRYAIRLMFIFTLNQNIK